MTDNIRITLDMTSEMADEINRTIKNTGMSKAQYMRIAIELMNMLANEKDAQILIKRRDETCQLFIPGINKPLFGGNV